ncbi:hypothetical protein [Chitinolyticbacter albus]|uniref:hypothetical protein n=1 Tax=Chitinolyticbacter albus TaxID=2961951 RepID=UPI00210AB72A|nr:hypothetical protein [Chitinolyticbacter albus]
MPTSQENVDATRQAVRALLERSEAFGALDGDKRRQLANDLVQIGTYLAEPGGERIAPTQQSPTVRALAEQGAGRRLTANRSGGGEEEGVFTAQSAREGAAVAGALLEAVNFPEFVAGLIDGVFHSIVTSSIQQMEAYAKLVADVSKSLSQFRDDNTTQNQGRDHLIEQFPDVFELTMDTGDFGGDFGGDSGASRGPRVQIREGVDERTAMTRLNQSLPLEQPLNRLDDAAVEAVLVPAARTQLASSRQQLLATTIMLGINRIVVTDGKIQAKVMYDFQARDNMQFRKSAQRFDYGDQYATTNSGTYEGESASSHQGASRGADGSYQGGSRDSSYYSKGEYKNTSQPVLKLASASQTSIDASLTTKASLAGVVEVNFKSDYLPLEKLANPEAIAAIQGNAQPGMVKNIVNRPAAPAPASPAAPAA